MSLLGFKPKCFLYQHFLLKAYLLYLYLTGETDRNMVREQVASRITKVLSQYQTKEMAIAW